MLAFLRSTCGVAAGLFVAAVSAQAQVQKPNIIFIMGDDVGWFNIGAYNQGIMGGKTPNLDQLAAEGMRFTDYYAEPSCTAGRANFITGELPIRTGLTTVGQAGADIGMPAEAPTIAGALKAMGYATGQFGKNHLGDLNKYLPTVHGFDEFFGYLYHLDAMEDPFWHSYPPALKDTVGPRNLLHTWASDADDPTEQPRWGKIGKQRIEDAGPLPPHPMQGIKYNMETVDDAILDFSFQFIDKAVEQKKPFFVWLNPTRMHIITHLSPKYQAVETPENGYYTEESGMTQLDDIVGSVMKKLKDGGLDKNTIVVFSTDNGAENFTWPDGGNTPFAGGKGTVLEGGMRVPAIIRWPDHVPAGKIENAIISGLDWFPTFVSVAGDSNIASELLQGKKLGDVTYKVHLDGYDQTSLITGKGPSNRHEIFYFAESTLGAVRIDDYKYRFIDQPNGWLGGTVKLDWPNIINLRLDPLERLGMPTATNGSLSYYDFFVHEFWRFVYVQKEVGIYAQTFIEYPPMQKGASFNMETVKQQIEAAQKKLHSQ
ncbi:arylsulfatase [Methyloferula stellata]|uniref:arylsulfatase n=1 Tax=Methyloferula stellata TaxID=876270 RepID=UPI00035C4EB6|nr:arylsulfatase [Methyloferula stellata]